MSNLQSLFDKVATHLLTQGKQSAVQNETGETQCLYRGPDGTKCAAGCLIPDALYSDALECKTVVCIPESIQAAMGITCAIEENLVWNLQQMHDHRPPSLWKERLLGVALTFNLDPSVVTAWPN